MRPGRGQREVVGDPAPANLGPKREQPGHLDLDGEFASAPMIPHAQTRRCDTQYFTVTTLALLRHANISHYADLSYKAISSAVTIK
jgi:hypothetical protein